VYCDPGFNLGEQSMTIKLNSITSWMAKLQGKLYENAMQRAQLEIRAALFENLAREIGQINDKYDGRKTDELENQIIKLTGAKENLADHLGHVNTAIKKLEDLRMYVDAARTEVTTGTAASFDENLENINNLVGSSVLDPNNLIGLKGRGSWAPRYVSLSAGRVEHTLESDYLGTDYQITFSDGSTTHTPDISSRTLEGTSFDSLTVSSLSGNSISYSDGANSYTGTIERGGLEILNAWAYNDFATASDQATAAADVDAAMQHIRKTELTLRNSQAVIRGMANKVGNEITNLAGEMTREAETDRTDREAEIEAISLRHELTLTNVSLTSKNQVAFIQNLFLTPPIVEKRNIFRVING